jgi:hypothetical protein
VVGLSLAIDAVELAGVAVIAVVAYAKGYFDGVHDQSVDSELDSRYQGSEEDSGESGAGK